MSGPRVLRGLDARREAQSRAKALFWFGFSLGMLFAAFVLAVAA